MTEQNLFTPSQLEFIRQCSVLLNAESTQVESALPALHATSREAITATAVDLLHRVLKRKNLPPKTRKSLAVITAAIERRLIDCPENQRILHADFVAAEIAATLPQKIEVLAAPLPAPEIVPVVKVAPLPVNEVPPNYAACPLAQYSYFQGDRGKALFKSAPVLQKLSFEQLVESILRWYIYEGYLPNPSVRKNSEPTAVDAVAKKRDATTGLIVSVLNGQDVPGMTRHHLKRYFAGLAGVEDVAFVTNFGRPQGVNSEIVRSALAALRR